MSENSIEFSLSNSEQRDSWLNSGHRTLDADTLDIVLLIVEVHMCTFLLLSIPLKKGMILDNSNVST